VQWRSDDEAERLRVRKRRTEESGDAEDGMNPDRQAAPREKQDRIAGSFVTITRARGDQIEDS
jgi:hypothetical protein